MKITRIADFPDYELVLRIADSASGLRAYVALHSTRRGPALGGCRMWNYLSDGRAIEDVLRLARGMTYKGALADLPFGGGKSVILGDPGKDKSPALLRAMGRAVEALGGRYVVAEDVGTSPADMAVMHEETSHVAGLDGAGGDPSPATAWGVFCGMRAAVRERLGKPDLEGLSVAIQGLGNVGRHLATLLVQDGAELVVADTDNARLAEARRQFGATVVPAYRIYDMPVDVFAPCALGAVLGDDTLPRLKAKVIAGSANNQLAEDRHGTALRDLKILYAPDYAINAGGVINIHHAQGGRYDQKAAFDHIARIYDTVLAICKRARRLDIPTSVAADQLAADRFRAKQAA